MKRILSATLILLMCLSLCACGSSGESESQSVESIVENRVKSYIMAEIALTYETEGVPTITYFVNQAGENQYEVTGKVTVKDKYGDSYTGKYDALVDYDAETGEAEIDTCDIDTLYKD